MDRQPEVEALLAASGVAFAYLFGSRARGEQRPDSDYDIGVWYSVGPDPMERFRQSCVLHEKLKQLLSGAVDLVILNDAKPPLQAEAVLKGKVLYPADLEAVLRFEARIRGRFEDYSYSQRFFTAARRKRLGLS